jgi:hypothetical protein
MNQVVGTFSFSEDTIIAGGHPAVVRSMAINAAQGVLAAGILLGLSATGLVPYESTDEVIDAGDGNAVAFTGTIAAAPIHPGSLSITDDTEAFADDGLGRLVGDAGGTGTINYTTGAYAVTFNAAPGNLQDITATSYNQLAGALSSRVDTAEEASGTVVVHGTVRADRLTKTTAGTALAAADTARLEGIGVWPV